MQKSNKWKMWYVTDDLKLCKDCEEQYGKIYTISETPIPRPPLHPYCRCRIERMSSLLAGTATKNGINGADWYLKYLNKLPDYYIRKNTAVNLVREKAKGNLYDVAPGKMMFGGVFYNDMGKLPEKGDIIWYEADINYSKGKRNSERIVYSNDGLIFITYDHYRTFIEIV